MSLQTTSFFLKSSNDFTVLLFKRKKAKDFPKAEACAESLPPSSPTPAPPTNLQLLDQSASVILEVTLGLQLVLQVLERLLQKLPFRERFLLSPLVVP